MLAVAPRAVEAPALALVEAARARVVLEHPEDRVAAAARTQLVDAGLHQRRSCGAPPRLRLDIDRVELAVGVAATGPDPAEADDTSVFFRDKDGLLRAVEDSVPHRQASLGRHAGEPLRSEHVRVRGLPRPHVNLCD